jgi:photosystem II stability/assembly factor-like uncharacterized protein
MKLFMGVTSLLHVLCAVILNAQDNVWFRMPCSGCGGAQFHDVDFPTPDTGFVASDLILYRTTDGGRSWTKLEREDLTRSGIGAISFPTGRIGYAAGKEILKTTDGGESWLKTAYVAGEFNDASIRSLSFTEDGFGVAVGLGLVVQTEDDGQSWNRGRYSACRDCRTVIIVDDSLVFAAGTTQALSVEGSVEWMRKGIGDWNVLPLNAVPFTFLYLYTMEVLHNGRIWLGGSRFPRNGKFNQHLVFSSDTGKTWNQPSTVLSAPVTAIAFVDSFMGFVGDEQGDIYRTADGGFTWAREYKGNAEQPINDIAIKGNTIIAVGDYSLILRRTELVSVTEDVPTNQPTLRLYPNPTNGVVTVASDGNLAQLFVVDVLGTVVMQLRAESKATLDLSAFPPGIYRVIAQTSAGIHAETVAVVR